MKNIIKLIYILIMMNIINNIGVSSYTYELNKNKGSKMVKHNLINNLPLIDNNNRLYIENYYFIEKYLLIFL